MADVQDRDVCYATLDPAEMGPVDVHPVGGGFLADAAGHPQPQPAHIKTEYNADIHDRMDTEFGFYDHGLYVELA